jgi:hypothetical protein
MFVPRLAHLIAAAAVASAAGVWWRSRRGAPPSRAAPRAGDDRASTAGRVHQERLVDGAIEDTFPASDPPSFVQSVVVGPPAHEEADAVERRQQHKRADEDAFAR